MDAPNLYNGNISSMVTTIKNPTTGNVLPQFTMYRYDQLNRLRNMKAFAGFNFTNNEWNYSSYDGRYQNDFTYDANGNIETAVANNANGDVIDNQVYNYYKPGNNKQNNRLYSITDIAAITSGKDLPSGQIAFDNADLLNNNYRYNELGELVYDKQSEIAEIKWTVYGKIKEVIHAPTSTKKNLKFDYDASGNRIVKYVYNPDNSLYKTVYFVRDASGNIMSTYEMNVDAQSEVVSYALTERPMYGSSRLGIDKTTIEFIGYSPSTTNITNHILGLKQYEGSNHLGNVLTIFTDKRIPVDEYTDGTVDYYKPDIVTSSDYAPFGAQLAERSFFSENYPNSFNGKRDDPELGDWQDYGMRMYIPFQRRFPSPDPLKSAYPMLSSYQFAANMPIWAIDLDGLEALIVNKNDNTITFCANVYFVTAGKGNVESPTLIRYTKEFIINRLTEEQRTNNNYVFQFQLNFVTTNSDGNGLTIEQAEEMAKNSVVTYTDRNGNKYEYKGVETAVVVYSADIGIEVGKDHADSEAVHVYDSKTKHNKILINSKLNNFDYHKAAKSFVHELGHFLGRRGKPNDADNHAGGFQGGNKGVTSRTYENIELVPKDLNPMYQGARTYGVFIEINKTATE